MNELAGTLTTYLGHPVVDATGLPGKYDFTLSWIVYREPGGPAEPMLQDAVQQQLGLRLVPKAGETKTFVIDRVEKPTQN